VHFGKDTILRPRSAPRGRLCRRRSRKPGRYVPLHGWGDRRDGNKGSPGERMAANRGGRGHHSQAPAGIDTSKSRNAAVHRRRALFWRD